MANGSVPKYTQEETDQLQDWADGKIDFQSLDAVLLVRVLPDVLLFMGANPAAFQRVCDFVSWKRRRKRALGRLNLGTTTAA